VNALNKAAVDYEFEAHSGLCPYCHVTSTTAYDWATHVRDQHPEVFRKLGLGS
jgi:hypothetical protein